MTKMLDDVGNGPSETAVNKEQSKTPRNDILYKYCQVNCLCYGILFIEWVKRNQFCLKPA